MTKDAGYETIRFLPEGEDRQGEGGLRTQGCLKKSYEDKPLISVITVVFNGEAYLEQTIQSVINQTYDNVEYIIIDGGSTDGTLDIIKKYEDEIDYWVSESDSGIYDAWNKGLSIAQGDWMAFLGSDDVYFPDAIGRYVSYLKENSNVDYISSRVELVNAKGDVIQLLGKRWNWTLFRKKMSVAHVGSLHHRQLYKKFGTYDIKYKIAADYELLLRPRDKLRAGFFNIPTAKMRIGGVSNNMMPALAEAKQAKHETGGRAKLLCSVDNVVDMAKIIIKKQFNMG